VVVVDLYLVVVVAAVETLLLLHLMILNHSEFHLKILELVKLFENHLLREQLYKHYVLMLIYQLIVFQ
jgi:hypothetical protein